MLRKITNLFLLLSIGIANAAQIQVPMTPENTVFVFDLHGVVLELAPQKPFKPFLKLNNKLGFIKKVFKYFNNKGKKSIEGVMLEDQADLDNQIALDICNPHRPIYGTVEILKQLKDMGYQIFGCSNIGEYSYKYMCTKYPIAFENFTDCYTSKLINNYCKKNNPLAFQETVKMIHGHSVFTPTYIIFVDDTRANLELATQVDSRFYGIYFTNSHQLRKSLQDLGITV